MYIIFFFLWLVFNGRITLEIVLIGFIISFFISQFSQKFLSLRKFNRKRIWRQLKISILYIINLIKEMVLANIHIIKIVLSPEIKISPCLTYFQAPIKGQGKRVVLANSITLTPGTITVDLDDNSYCIHAIEVQLARDLDQSSFVKILQKMEEGE